jgi:hypothetical protein
MFIWKDHHGTHIKTYLQTEWKNIWRPRYRSRYSYSLRSGRSGDCPGGSETSRVAHTGADAHPAIRTMGTVSFPEVIWPECIAHLPSHSGARFRMGWSYTSTSPPCLYSRVRRWPLWYCRTVQPGLTVEWVAFFCRGPDLEFRLRRLAVVTGTSLIHSKFLLLRT